MPKISIIVPVYNTEKYLCECLKSIVNQTLKDIEIIVINDNSPDNSIEIITDFVKKDNRIVLIDKEKNEGVGKARNDGIKAAKGQFICFMDSDDMYPNIEALEKLYLSAINNSVSIAGGRRERLYSDGRIVKDDKTIKDGDTVFIADGLTEYADYQYDYGYWCYIYNRELLIENRIEFPPYSRFQDPPFFVKAMIAAKSFYMLDEYVYRYRYIDSDEKYTYKKTVDQLQGVIDNLIISKQNNLPKLHYISAVRLNTECGYMVSRNMESFQKYYMVRKLIDANALVDEEWLSNEGIVIKPFVLDLFKYWIDTANKYEKLRNKKVLRPIKKLLRKK